MSKMPTTFFTKNFNPMHALVCIFFQLYISFSSKKTRPATSRIKFCFRRKKKKKKSQEKNKIKFFLRKKKSSTTCSTNIFSFAFIVQILPSKGEFCSFFSKNMILFCTKFLFPVHTKEKP